MESESIFQNPGIAVLAFHAFGNDNGHISAGRTRDGDPIEDCELHAYKPEPIDISRVELDDKIRGLVETLAKNAHDVWARKKNPNLVPYEDLPEKEKDYDREMVSLTLKGTIALGFTIKKNP